MDYCYSYFYNSSTNFEPKKLACEAGFIDEGGSAVPLPEELTKMFKPLECELCGVVVTSEVTAYTHYEGKVHMKNVNAFMKEQYNIYGSMKKIKVEFTPHLCEVCKCELSSLIQAQQHYTGKVHKKNLRKINYDPQASMANPSEINDDELGPDLLKDLPPPPPPPVLSDFICEICNITTNTEYQLIVHKNGSKHKRKVKKLKESFGDFGTDGFGYFTGDMPSENYSESQECTSVEPIVTDYLPLSNEPLQFNNIINSNNFQYNVNPTQFVSNQFEDEENDQNAPLCIKWFNDKKEAPPTRPMEEAWVETFNKTAEETQIHALSTKMSQNLNNLIIPSRGENNYFIPPSTSNISDIRTYEVSPEIADLPQFSVATVLPQLQAPPSPPIGLITSALFEISDKTVTDDVETSSCLDPPRIRFRDTKIQPDKGTCESSVKQDNIDVNCKEQEISDPASSTNIDKTLETPKTLSFEVTPVQNNQSARCFNKEKPSKAVISSEQKKNNEENRGKFITSNWEKTEEKNIDNENDQLKKKGLNVLFGFKKGLIKKTTENINKNPDNNLQEISISKESKKIDIKDRIEPIKEIRIEKAETSYEKINLNKEYNSQEKQSYDSKEDESKKDYSDKKGEESKYSKVKSHSKYRKDKYEKDSHDYHRNSYDYHKDSRDYYKDSHGYRKDFRDYRKNSNDYYKESDDYCKDSRDNRKSKDDYKKRRGHRKRKDDYDSCTDSNDEDYRREKKKYRHSSRSDDEDYRYEKKKHRHSSRSDDEDYRNEKKRHRHSSRSDDEDYRNEKKKHKHSSRREKESHKNKKPSLAQPFLHKTSTKHSIIDYLAPASECDSYDIAMYRTPSGSYYCTRCDYKSKNSSEFTNHLYSRDHKEKKKNKTKLSVKRLGLRIQRYLVKLFFPNLLKYNWSPIPDDSYKWSH
ncbi:unnamed protein product [Nezara viridula]|uniref:C2H2-type domain-containing protein n=1 Tax=Nezara viridula TaxID=85310 RepID=A0A9P0E7R8_NEZVI|nr:unnamed protein product [Nezara viridula]